MQKAEQSTGVLQSALKGLGGVLATMGLAYSLGGAITQNIAYADSLAEVSTLVDTTTFDMVSLSDEALKQANRFGAMPVDGTKAFYQAISAGASTAEKATEAMTSANKLAIGGVTDVTTAVDGLTSASNAYGEEAGSMTDISDSMFVAMKAGKTTIGELSGSIGNLAPISAQAGASFDEMMAATAALTKGGVSTSTAMDGLKGILASVIKPSGEAAKMASSLGLQFDAAALKSKGFAGFLEDVRQKTGGSTEKMAMLFGGVEALAPMLALTGKASGDFAETLAAMANKAGMTEEAFTKMSNSPGFQIQRIIAGISAEFLKLGQGGTSMLVPVLKAIADNLHIVSTAGNFLIGVAFSVIDHLQQFGVIDAVSTAFWLAGDAINYVSEMFGGASGGITEFLGGFGAIAVTAGGVSAAIGIVSIAISAMGAILLANPISLTIAAIGTAVYLIYNNWEGVVVWWNELWASVQQAADGFLNWWNGTTFQEKALDIATGAVELARTATTHFFTWWDGSTLKQHSPEIVVSGVEKARELTTRFFTWWDSYTLAEKVTQVKTEAIATATSIAERFTSWWNDSTLTEKYTEVSTFYLDTAESSAGKFINWWNGSVLAELITPIDTNPVTAAREKATAFIGWWNASPLSEKLADIETNPIELARAAATSFFNWWDASTLKKHSPKIVTDAIESARQSITGFFNWWDNTSLTEKTADVTAETLIWAWEQAQKFEAWWNNLSLKSLVPEIKMPTMAGIKDSAGGMWDWAKGVGGDIADGIGLGIDRADAHISAAKKAAKGIETAVRTELDTHSPSRVMAAVGLDVSMGFAEGIESGGSKVKSAAEKAAQAAEAAFRRIVEGLEKQYLKLTQGDEAARRYELSMQNIVGANQDAVIAAEAHIKKLEEQEKQQQAATQAAKQAATEQARIAKQLTDSLVTPYEAHEKAIKQYDDLLEAGAITQETYARAVAKQAKALADATGVTEAAKKAQEAINKVMAKGQQLTESMRRPQEIFSDAIDEYEKLLKAGAISQETYNRALADQKKKLDDATGATKAAKAAQDAHNKIMAEGAKIYEATRTNSEKLATETENLNKLLQAGAIDTDTYNRAMSDARDKLDTVGKALKDLQKEQELQNIAMTEGAAAAEIARLKMDGYSEAQAANKVATEENMAFQQEFYDTLVSSIENAESVKDFFDGLGDWMKSWLKEQIAHFAANKIMAFIGVGGSGASGGFNLGSLFGGSGQSSGGFSLSSLFGGGTGAGTSGGFSLGSLWSGANSMVSSGLSSIGGFLSNSFGGIGSSISGMFGGVGSALSGIGSSVLGSLGGIGSTISGALGSVGSALGGITAALGPIGIAAGILSLGFGKKKTTGAGVEVGYSDASGFSGQNYETWKKKKWFKYRTGTDYSEMDSGAEESIKQYFYKMDSTITAQAEAMGVRGAENILKGFKTATVKLGGDDIDGQLQTWLGDTTNEAYEHAFGKLPTALKQAIDPAYKAIEVRGGLFGSIISRTLGAALSKTSLSAEELAARFQYVAAVTQTVQPSLEALGFELTETETVIRRGWFRTITSVREVAGSAAKNATLLTDELGGVDSAMQILSYYASNFAPEGLLAAKALEQTREQLNEWNASIGLTGDAIIDTKDEFYQYVQALDLTTEAGREAMASAMAQMQTLLAVAAANEEAKIKLDAVADAARNLNLNFDATSPLASGAASALIELMGGLESFTAATQNYYDQFYSQTEQQQLALAQSADAVSVFNEAMGLSGAAAIDTAAEFRAYVESLDLTTAEGREAYAAAMDVASAMAAVADSGMSLNELIDSLPENLISAFELMSGGSQVTADKIGDAANDINSASDVAGDSLNDLGGAITSVANAAASAANTAAQAAASAASAAAQASSAASDASSAASAASSAANDANDSATTAAEAAENSTTTGAVPAYATGGYYPGGLALVGEQGPELINFSQPGYVYTAAETQRLMDSQAISTPENLIDIRPVLSERNSGRSDDQLVAELKAELKALREQVGQLDNNQVNAIVPVQNNVPSSQNCNVKTTNKQRTPAVNKAGLNS